MSGRLHHIFVFALAVLLMALAVPLAAQIDVSTGTLKGSIIDPTAAAVPAASVTIISLERGFSKTVLSGDDGTYQIPLLQPGVYRVEVVQQGFEKAVAEKVEVTIGQVVIYDIHLVLGSVSDVMQVTEAAPLIEAEKTQQANTLAAATISNLPNLTRNFSDSVFTLPGVSNSDAPRLQNPGYTGFMTSGFSVGGSSGRNNLITFDGGENDYGSGQLRTPNVSVESVQEFQVNRNALAAEFGFTSGTAVNVITKSGTNDFHGSAYGFFRDQNLEARNYFDTLPGKPFDQLFTPGATFGGPILKDKLFFFTSYEFRKVDTPEFKSYLNTPDALGLNGNPAQLNYVNALAATGDPTLTTIAGIFRAALNPISNPNVASLLTSNSGVFPDVTRSQDWVTRVDYQPTQNDTLTFRASFMHWNYTQIGSNNLYAASDSGYIHEQDFGILGSWNHIFNPQMVNQVRVQVIPYNNVNEPSLSPGSTELSIGSLGVFNRSYTVPYSAQEERFQFEDYFTWMKGKHTLKFGASYRPVSYNVQNNLWFGGEFDFADGTIPLIALIPSSMQASLAGYNLGHGYGVNGPGTTYLSALESFSLGLPIDYRQGFGNPSWSAWAHYLGGFAQDTWKITPRFTLSYGARFDFDAEPSPLQHNVYFSPRLGLAWDPFGDGKTVIRAGGGIFVAPVNFMVDYLVNILNDSGQYINQYFTAINSPGVNSATVFGYGEQLGKLPFGSLTQADLANLGVTVGPGAPGRVIFNLAPNYKNTYTIQGSFSIARELARNLSLELGYQMYKGVHLQLDQETNYRETGVIDPEFGPQYAPINPNIIQANTYSSIGNSTYNGLTVSLTKRYSRNFQAQANYTFSKAIDDVTDFNSQFASFFPTRLNLERGISAYNVPNNFVANAVYNSPLKAGTGESIWSHIFADMTFAPVVHLRSGVPFTIRVPGAENGTLGHNLYARPWYVERNTGIGPAFYDFDARLVKSIYIDRDKGLKLELIAEGTNLLNHTNFSSVNDQFPVGDPFLLTGPFNVQGNKSLSPTTPLGFTSAFAGRQMQVAVRFAW